MKPMPIGVSDFKRVIKDCYYIDKTLFIKDIIDELNGVLLIARPRRFGKTLNMSMLKYYFENNKEYSNLFDGLNISKSGEKYKQEQNKYPVIYITLKDVKCDDWENTYHKLKTVIQSIFIKYKSILISDKFETEEKDYVTRILNLTGTQADYEDTLSKLTNFLYRYYNIEPILLIDEYDVPIQSGHVNKFYNNIISFMRNWLSGGLKDNNYLKFAVITGILRVAKESIFSGLNNLEISTVLDKKYNTYFGFTQQEVEQIARDYKCEDKILELKDWYNGYKFGDIEIYNSWSVINYFRNDCTPKAYWLNTSSNDIIYELIKEADNKMKDNLKFLLEGKKVECVINTHIVYNDIKKHHENLYSFLLLTGYLKVISSRIVINSTKYTLAIPNKELLFVYQEEILNQLVKGMSFNEMIDILDALLQGDINTFKTLFEDLILKCISYIDTTESFYHGLVLGIVALLIDTHYVKSNRESGYGRFDIMLIPKDKNLQGIIIEFKVSNKEDNLKEKAEEALKQIDDKKYETELKNIGITDIYKYGIAFCGKQVEIICNI